MSGTRGREATGVALPEYEGRSAEAVETTLGFWAKTCTIKSFRHIIGVYGPDLFTLPPPTDPERRHAKVQLQKTATHMTYTRNVPTIAHWRTSPRNAPTSRDLHDGISWQITSTALDAAECAHAHRAKNRPQTPKDGRERAPARQRGAHDECDACAGCRWRSEAATRFDWCGVSEVRDAMWGWCGVCRMPQSAPAWPE